MHQRHTYKIMSIVTILLGSVFISSHVSAVTYQSEESVFFTFNPAMSLTVSGDLNIDDLAPGLVADSNIITVTAGANSSLGYTLYANVGDADNNYTDLRLVSTDNVNKFAVLSAPVTTLNDIGGGKWGYSYCDATSSAANCNTASNWVYGSTGSTNTGYGIMPLYNNVSHATDVKIADTSSADATTVKFKIGAKSADSQAAGSYTNVINFIGIPKIQTVDYTLNYVDRSGTVSSSTMPSPNPQTGTTTSDTFNISNATPINTNTNLAFRGWCTVDNASDSTSCSGTMINPGSMYVIANPSAIWSGSVYAVWKEKIVTFNDAFAVAGRSKYNGYYEMQDIDSSICAAVTNGQIGTLVDVRGSNPQTYNVGKLNDGKCWLLDNLALGSDSSAITLTPNDTNITANWALPKSVTSGFTTYTEPLINTTYNATIPQGEDPLKQQALAGNWKVGTYYNYCAASAGSYCPAEGAAAGPVEQDICPKGWRTPSSGPGGEYQVIYDAYGKNYTNFRTALHLPLSGSYNSAQVYYQGSAGRWWSSTFYNGSSMYYLRSSTSGITPQYAGDRYVGFSMRCVAK